MNACLPTAKAKLEAALAYARMHWRIFPCHSIIDGRCSCGKATCESPGKHPLTKRGFKDATDNPNQIHQWWEKNPLANIALATGQGLVGIDIDGNEGFQQFKRFVDQFGPVPETLTAQTGRGAHLVYATPHGVLVRSAARGKVHVRGEGGYIIVAPSNHICGQIYQWIKRVPVAPLPDILREWIQGHEISRERVGDELATAALPDYLAKNQLCTNDIPLEIKTEYSSQEHGRLVSALAAIPSQSYEIWFQVGMALRDLDWERSDGTSIAFEIWNAWSALTPEKYSLAACEAKWRSFGRRSGITLGTVYHIAQQHGWTGVPVPLGSPPVRQNDGGLNGHASGPQTLPAAFLGAPIHFPDVTEDGKIRATMVNAKVAIGGLGIACRFDLFHNRYLLAGAAISQWCTGEISDPVVLMVRDRVRARWGFDPGTQHTRDAAEALCLSHSFDPVLDYLDSLQWDGVPRLDCWLTTYMGADDSELYRVIARLSLIAAVRRAHDPGTKFDHIVVLEGPQGAGKSEAIRILAGSENFSDQKILGVDDRKQQELTEGVWLYEIAELTGLRKAEREHVKAFVSRTVDRARPAYGRYTVSQPRRTVFFGSTNQDIYLEDDTGNRRFWPVKIGRIDLDGLQRDRDRLWAEATYREAQGESHTLPERLWQEASEAQAGRTIQDEWQDHIANYVALKGLAEVSISQVLSDNQFLGIAAADIGQREQNRASGILRGLGFTRFQKRLDDGRRVWRYRKS